MAFLQPEAGDFRERVISRCHWTSSSISPNFRQMLRRRVPPPMLATGNLPARQAQRQSALPTNDGLLEFNLVNQWPVYENLKLNLELGHIVNMLDQDTWQKAGYYGSTGNASFEKQDAWKAQLPFAYAFQRWHGHTSSALGLAGRQVGAPLSNPADDGAQLAREPICPRKCWRCRYACQGGMRGSGIFPWLEAKAPRPFPDPRGTAPSRAWKAAIGDGPTMPPPTKSCVILWDSLTWRQISGSHHANTRERKKSFCKALYPICLWIRYNLPDTGFAIIWKFLSRVPPHGLPEYF